MELDTPTPRLSTPTFTPHEANDIDFRLGFMIDFFKRGSITDSTSTLSSDIGSATPSAKANTTNGKPSDAAAGLSTKKEKKRSSEESVEHLSNGINTPDTKRTSSDGSDKSSKKSRPAEGETSSKKHKTPTALTSLEDGTPRKEGKSHKHKEHKASE